MEKYEVQNGKLIFPQGITKLDNKYKSNIIMKKNLVLLALIGFAMFTLCGCGKSKEKLTVTGQNGQEYESYQECCAAQDFQAAHQFLAKMENSDDWQSEVYDAKRFVFKQEALYLVSLGSEEAQKRIIYLLKEVGADDRDIFMLIDLAIANGDDALVVKLACQMKELRNRENKFLNDIIPILAKDSDPKAVNLIVRYILEEKESKRQIHSGTPAGAIMKEEPSVYNEQLGGYFPNNKDLHIYAIRQTNELNELCDRILAQAIENNNKELALKIVDEYVPVPCAWNEGKRASFSNSAQMAAKEKLKKAGF